MSGGLIDKVYIGLDHAPAAFDIKNRILGPNGTNLEYIRSETGVVAVLKSYKCEPLHLALHHTRSECLDAARSLAQNLIETIRAELAQWNAAQAGGPPPALNVPPPTLATTTAPPPIPPPVATVALSTSSTLTSSAPTTVLPPVVSVAPAPTPLMTVRQPTVLQLLPQQQYVLNQENGQLIPIVQPGVQVSNTNFKSLPIAQSLEASHYNTGEVVTEFLVSYGEEIAETPSTSNNIVGSSHDTPITSVEKTTHVDEDDDENYFDTNFVVELRSSSDDEEFVPLFATRNVAQPEEALPTMAPETSRRLAAMDAASDAALREMNSSVSVCFNWQSDPSTFVGKREAFSGQAGLTFPGTDLQCPLDAFRKIWHHDIMDQIAIETNRYAKKLLDESTCRKPTSRLNRWKPTTREELYIFFAIILHQSLAPLPREADYFTSIGPRSLKGIRDIMTYNRFLLLKKFLHFCGDEDATRNKLKKIQPIIDHLNCSFQALYMPGQNIAIDESLLKWTGRLSITQKIYSKAARMGIKSYELCESETGYLWRFIIYTGAKQRWKQTDRLTDRLMSDQTAPLPKLYMIWPALSSGRGTR